MGFSKYLCNELLTQNTSIPQSCDSCSETVGAYRFLRNPEVPWEGILAPHWVRTQERMRARLVVRCIQDTAELDFRRDLLPVPPQSGGEARQNRAGSAAPERRRLAERWLQRLCALCKKIRESQTRSAGLTRSVKTLMPRISSRRKPNRHSMRSPLCTRSSSRSATIAWMGGPSPHAARSNRNPSSSAISPGSTSNLRSKDSCQAVPS